MELCVPMSKKILLVEDEALIAMSEKRELEKYDYLVHHVTTGEKAVQAILDNVLPVDLILMDIDLGSGIDGTQAAEKILNHKDIPVVFLSSHTEPEVVEKTEKITSYGYVVKNSGIVVLDASIKMAFKLFEANRRILGSEIKQKTMLANISDVIVIIDKKGVNRYKSPNITKLFGWKPEELIGKSTWDNVHPDDLRDAQLFFNGIMEEPGATGTAEFRYRCKNGEYAIIEITLMNLLHDKVIQGLLGNYHNISNRKKIEEEQLALAALVENSNDIAIVKNIERRIISGNKNFVQASMSESLSDLVGKTDADILGIPEDQEPVHSYMLDDLKALKLKPGESLLREEGIPSEEGLLRTYMTRKFPISIASKVIGIGVITTDITTQKQNEEEIKSQNTLLSMIMETSPVGITTVDKTGNITYANKRAEEILGLVKGEITSRTYDAPLWNHTDLDGSPLLDEKQPFNIVKTTMTTAYNVQHGITWPDGGVVLLSINASPMKDIDGNFNGMVATLEDITDAKNNEEIIFKQLTEKETMVKEVHHRIKNNISSIESFLSLQADDTNNVDAKKILNNATSRVQSMRILYDKLLMGKSFEEASIKEYADSIIDSIVEIFGEKKDIITEKEISDFIISTKILFPIGIIINELFTNIYKYAFKDRNSGTIFISIKKTKNLVTLIIHDNGIGIDERKKLNKSPGFGLTIVKMLVEQLQGTYSIQNDNGTKFQLLFNI